MSSSAESRVHTGARRQARPRVRVSSHVRTCVVSVLLSGMAAQRRKRPTFTLTLDPDVVRDTRAVLKGFPGRGPSLSGLVDDLLREFVANFGPLVKEFEAADGDRERQLTILHTFFGMQMAGVSEEFLRIVRATRPEDEGS